jgi:hypothetical protein
MSIDDLGRSAAQDLRATAAGTFDVDGGLERIPVSSRRRTVAQQGSALAILVLVLIVGAFAIRPQLGAVPDPVDSLTPTPSVTRPTAVPAPAGPFEALFVRGTSLVAIDAQGRERAVRDLAPSKLSAADLEFAYASTAGWLAVEPGGSASKGAIGHEFVNLLDPQAKPVLVRGLFDQRTWSPDGTRLATTKSGKGLVIIDAATGAETTLDQHGQGLPGGGPSVIWTADGSGIVVAGGSQRPGSTFPQLFVAPVDGAPLQSTVPDLWERGGHSVTAGGLQLDTTPCFLPDCPAGQVRVIDPSGAATELYSGDVAGTTLADATLSRDGRSAFLLLASAVPNRLEIAHSDAGRRPTVLATVPVVTTAGASLGISPDDSTVLVATITNPDAANPTINYYVVPLDGSPAYAAQGSFAGWVPTEVVNAIAATR